MCLLFPVRGYGRAGGKYQGIRICGDADDRVASWGLRIPRDLDLYYFSMEQDFAHLIHILSGVMGPDCSCTFDLFFCGKA